MAAINIRAVYHEVYRVARINARHNAYEAPSAFDIFRGPEAAASRGVRFPGTGDMTRYDRAYNAACAAASKHADSLAEPFPWDNVADEFPFAVMTIRYGFDRSALRDFRGRMQTVEDERRDPTRLP